MLTGLYWWDWKWVQAYNFALQENAVVVFTMTNKYTDLVALLDIELECIDSRFDSRLVDLHLN